MSDTAKPCRIVVETYMDGEQESSLTHTFHGATREEAEDMIRQHYEADSFFASCIDGKYKGGDCESVAFYEDEEGNEEELDWDELLGEETEED